MTAVGSIARALGSTEQTFSSHLRLRFPTSAKYAVCLRLS